MRLRNVKEKDTILATSPYLVGDPNLYRGNWQSLFPKRQPLHVEIGMGKGKFLIEMALLHKEINFLGIDRYDSILARALPKIPDDLPNIKVIRMNAMEIDKVFDREVDTIYLNFSDPWPKIRHQERRLSSPTFLKKYDILFQKNAHIILKTDNRALFEYSLISLSQYGYQIEKISLDLAKEEDPENVVTEYEQKFSKLGNPIYRVDVRKMAKTLEKNS